MLLRDQGGAHSLRDAFEVTVEFFVAVVVGDITLCSDPCLYQGLGRPPPTWSLGVWEERIIEKTLTLGKIEGRRRKGRQRIRWLDGIIDSMNMGLGGPWELVMVREAWLAAVHGITKSWT